MCFILNRRRLAVAAAKSPEGAHMSNGTASYLWSMTSVHVIGVQRLLLNAAWTLKEILL